MNKDLKGELITRMKKAGAFDVRISDPQFGYEHVGPNLHPLKLWHECRSVISFAIAGSVLLNDIYIGPYAPWNGERDLGPVPSYLRSNDFALDRLGRLILASITLKAIALLNIRGYQVSFADRTYGLPFLPQLKLYAFESGLGVYGKSGLILHPELGSRIRLGAIFTNAELEPDQKLVGFNPCENCNYCVESCPAKAIEQEKKYPDSYSVEKCVETRRQLKKNAKYCNNCYNVCPSGNIKRNDLVKIAKADNIYESNINLDNYLF